MEFSKLITRRYSVRAYKPDPVEEGKLQEVLEAACLAPTANNQQPFRLIVVHTAGREEELKRIYAPDWFVRAPVVICACALAGQGWIRRDGRSYLDVDVAIVMDHLILAAANVGLGTCWIANFDETAAHQVLRLPDDVEPIIFTPLGYPADRPGPKRRQLLASLVRYENW